MLQHVEEAAHLRAMRTRAVRARSSGLRELVRLDQRIEAHLDAVGIAGETGSRLCLQALERADVGQSFVSMVGSIERADLRWIGKLVEAAQVVPSVRTGIYSAFGWVRPSQLRGISTVLMASADPWQREVGLASCELHGIDPGPILATAIDSASVLVRRRALQVAGVVGRQDLLDPCRQNFDGGPDVCVDAAIESALLLGDRGAAVEAARSRLVRPDAPVSTLARQLCMLMIVEPPGAARATLAVLTRSHDLQRLVVEAAGWTRDPAYVPWLLDQTGEPRLGRLAAVAIAEITGADIASMALGEEAAAEPADAGDTGTEPIDALDDEDLAQPDPDQLRAWWNAHRSAMPSGRRHWAGASEDVQTLQMVLRSGSQRQRAFAALSLVLRSPGRRLFNVAAPAARQTRQLA